MRLKALLASRGGGGKAKVTGEWLGSHGEVIRVSGATKYTAGMCKESLATNDVWSRSVYGLSTPDKVWECFESDAMRTNEMITKIGLGRQVCMLVECYSPRSHDAFVPLEDPLGAPLMVSQP